MAPPTKVSLQAELTVLRRRITVALELHRPGMPLPGVRYGGDVRYVCSVCRDPYPCDTAVALGDR